MPISSFSTPKASCNRRSWAAEEGDLSACNIEEMMAQSREFPHHMIKEIFEQPQALRDTIEPRIMLEESTVRLKDVPITVDEIRAARRINIVALSLIHISE